MNNYILTGFDEKYWPTWGISWILSLKKTNFKDKILIVDLGLLEETKKKITSFENVFVLPLLAPTTTDHRLNVLLTILEFTKNLKGKCVYWDADVCFQSAELESIFDHIEDDKFILSENKNFGFLAVNLSTLRLLKNINKYLQRYKNQNNFNSVMDLLTIDFNDMINFIDNTWNQIDIDNVSFDNNKIKVGGKIPKAIHFASITKKSFEGKGLFYQERNKQEILSILGKGLKTRPIFKK